jgi:hypothetical protein
VYGALTEDVVFIERLAPSGWEPMKNGHLFQFPTQDIEAVLVEEHSAAHSSWGWEGGTGFLHGARQHGPSSAVNVRVRTGEQVIFRINGSPLEVRAYLTRLGGAPSADAPAPAPDRLSQLERLAALRADGVLSDEEFEREKARVLGT